MARDRWREVDTYIENQLHVQDDILRAALKANAEAGLPDYDVSPAQGAFLQILVSITGAKRVLEIGTLGGYSSICMARALPDGGKLVSLEYEPRHAEVARSNVERAGLGDKVEIITGAAADTLQKLGVGNVDPFDFVFIDADKSNNPLYLDWALKLSRKGALIICDNVVRDGDIVDGTLNDPTVTGARAAFDFVSKRQDLKATALQTVGNKGYDGFLMLVAG